MGLSNVAVTSNGCHEYLGSKQKLGYATIRCAGKIWYGHRLAWHQQVGEIPSGMHVLHKCDNRGCVNVDHLFLGTHQDNMRDRDMKERGGSTKLSADKVRAIRAAAASGRTHQAIADEYGVSQPNITQIVNRQRWRWVD